MEGREKILMEGMEEEGKYFNYMFGSKEGRREILIKNVFGSQGEGWNFIILIFTLKLN